MRMGVSVVDAVREEVIVVVVVEEIADHVTRCKRYDKNHQSVSYSLDPL